MLLYYILQKLVLVSFIIRVALAKILAKNILKTHGAFVAKAAFNIISLLMDYFCHYRLYCIS